MPVSRKALIVAPTYPYPIDGGNLVALHGYHVAMRHAGIGEVHFLGFDDAGHPVGQHFEQARLVAKPPKVTAAGAARFAFGQSILFSRYRAKAFSAALRQAVEQQRYDVVLFQHAYVGRYLTEIQHLLPAGCLKVISAEVLESRAFLKKAELAGNPLLRLAFTRESQLLDRQETDVFNQFDRVTFFSEEDRQHFRRHGGRSDAQVVNLGIEVDRYPFIPPADRQDGRLKVTFFGAFSWFANTDALTYLLHEVWPVVKQAVPQVDLVIAGRDIPEWVHQHADERLVVAGRVPSIGTFLEGMDVVLSPIRIGGGIRLKILESLAYGRTVLSTRAGLEGLDPQILPLVQAVDTPQEYAQALARLVSAPHANREQAKTASEVVRMIYDARKLSPLFIT